MVSEPTAGRKAPADDVVRRDAVARGDVTSSWSEQGCRRSNRSPPRTARGARFALSAAVPLRERDPPVRPRPPWRRRRGAPHPAPPRRQRGPVGSSGNLRRHAGGRTRGRDCPVLTTRAGAAGRRCRLPIRHGVSHGLLVAGGPEILVVNYHNITPPELSPRGTPTSPSASCGPRGTCACSRPAPHWPWPIRRTTGPTWRRRDSRDGGRRCRPPWAPRSWRPAPALVPEPPAPDLLDPAGRGGSASAGSLPTRPSRRDRRRARRGTRRHADPEATLGDHRASRRRRPAPAQALHRYVATLGLSDAVALRAVTPAMPRCTRRRCAGPTCWSSPPSTRAIAFRWWKP